MSKDESSKVVVDLSEELSASELELLRKYAEVMGQSLGSCIAWFLFCSDEREDVPETGKEWKHDGRERTE